MEIRFEKKKKLSNEAVSIEKYRTESSHMKNKKVNIVIKNSMWLYNYIIRYCKVCVQPGTLGKTWGIYWLCMCTCNHGSVRSCKVMM